MLYGGTLLYAAKIELILLLGMVRSKEGCLMTEGRVGTADFVDNQRKSRLCLLDSTESSNVVRANCRKNRPSDVQVRIRRLFRDETKPWYAVFSPPSRSDVPFGKSD